MINSWPKVLFQHKRLLVFSRMPFAKMKPAKRNRKKNNFVPPALPSDLNTLVMHGASPFWVALLASFSDDVQSFIQVVWYLFLFPLAKWTGVGFCFLAMHFTSDGLVVTGFSTELPLGCRSMWFVIGWASCEAGMAVDTC